MSRLELKFKHREQSEHGNPPCSSVSNPSIRPSPIRPRSVVEAEERAAAEEKARQLEEKRREAEAKKKLKIAEAKQRALEKEMKAAQEQASAWLKARREEALNENRRRQEKQPEKEAKSASNRTWRGQLFRQDHR